MVLFISFAIFSRIRCFIKEPGPTEITVKIEDLEKVKKLLKNLKVFLQRNPEMKIFLQKPIKGFLVHKSI